jgi:voltage-gated potassium channel
MKKIHFPISALWNTLLVAAVIFAAFLLPIIPPAWQRISFKTAYTLIYITAILSLEKRSNYTILLFLITVLLEWFSGMFHMEIMFSVSRGMNILFFLVIVASLIKQIAMAREVTSGVILSSIAGYLLMGIVYSIFISFIIQNDPAAFTSLQMEDSGTGEGPNASVPLYFGYVTLASLGYGDVVPLKPYTRSLATFIAISGQFYMAIIVALLIGKFSAQQHKKTSNHA